MPNATANLTDTKRFDLKSLPEGFIELRRMTYGQSVQRRALLKLSVNTGGGRNKSFSAEMAMASEEIQLFEFRHCIVEHNLDDAQGRRLNLGSPADFALLDPRVGQEIEKYISEMNNFDDEEERLGD